jgi:hypothetical protein
MSWRKYVGGLSPGPAAIPNLANPSGPAARLLRTRPARRGWAGAVTRESRVRVVPRRVPHRPAARRRIAEHRHVPGRAATGRRPGRRAVAQQPRHGDQSRSPPVPVLAPLRVTPPVRTRTPIGTIRTRVRMAREGSPGGGRQVCAAPSGTEGLRISAAAGPPVSDSRGTRRQTAHRQDTLANGGITGPGS